VEWATFGTHPLDRRPDVQNDWLAKSTWIEWWKRSPIGMIELVWDPAANEAWKTAVPSDVGYRRRNGFKPKYCSGLDCSRIQPSKSFPNQFKSPPLEYSILQFWTLSIRMGLELDLSASETEMLDWHHIVDKNGRRCGNFRSDLAFSYTGQLVEFIVLSECCSDLHEEDYLARKEYFDTQRLYSYSDEAFWVMLLEWKDGVAERRGLGSIDQISVNQCFDPGPCWKEIYLG
jgi:hypothetical protein